MIASFIPAKKNLAGYLYGYGYGYGYGYCDRHWDADA